MAPCCPKYCERPQIALVLSSSKGKLLVRWYDGAWSTKWKPYEYFMRRKRVLWEEEVEKDNIVKKSIQLTPSGNLTIACRRELQSLYKTFK